MSINIVKIWLQELKAKWYSESSKRWRLNVRDFVQGLLMAVIAGVITSVYTAYSNDGTIDWEAVKKAVAIASLAYLSKKFMQGEK